MIITGYQGIGKSTLAKNDDRIIDLESTCFWKVDRLTGEKTSPDDWYVYYSQIAIDLSNQGYTVFVSCHPQVRDFLSSHARNFNAIFPSKNIKEDWIKRLENRYKESGLEKDKRALEHAQKFYDSDINRLWYECQYGVEYYHNVEIIDDINYDLVELVNRL